MIIPINTICQEFFSAWFSQMAICGWEARRLESLEALRLKGSQIIWLSSLLAFQLPSLSISFVI